MEVCALASGSSGNCFYVEHEGKSLLVDAGLSCKKTSEILGFLEKNIENIGGLLLTHEHSDHVKGAGTIIERYKVPVFATKGTFDGLPFRVDEEFMNVISRNETLKLGGMSIEAFEKPHLAGEPVSFSVSAGDKKASIITDLGKVNSSALDAIASSNLICLESNHDTLMLENGPYPAHLKKWIKSDAGHLSNMQAALAVLEHGSKKLKNLVLSHLSKTNNTPEIALRTFDELLVHRKDLRVSVEVSSRNTPTKMLRV